MPEGLPCGRCLPMNSTIGDLLFVNFKGFYSFFAMIFSSRFFKVILKPFLKPFLRAHKKTAHPFLGAGCSVSLFFQLW